MGTNHIAEVEGLDGLQVESGLDGGLAAAQGNQFELYRKLRGEVAGFLDPQIHLAGPVAHAGFLVGQGDDLGAGGFGELRSGSHVLRIRDHDPLGAPPFRDLLGVDGHGVDQHTATGSGPVKASEVDSAIRLEFGPAAEPLETCGFHAVEWPERTGWN